MITLRITEAKIENDLIVIDKIAIFEDGKEVRDARINENTLNLLKSIEIDPGKFHKIKGLLSRNPDLKLLVETFDLTLL